MQTTTRGVIIVFLTIRFMLSGSVFHVLVTVYLLIRQIVQAFAAKEPEQTPVEHGHQLRMMCADMSQQILAGFVRCIPVFRELINQAVELL